MLASLLYPYDPDAPMLISSWLDELEAGGHIQRYQVENQSYLQVINFLIHQKIDRPSASKFPAFDEASTNPRESSRRSISMMNAPFNLVSVKIILLNSFPF